MCVVKCSGPWTGFWGTHNRDCGEGMSTKFDEFLCSCEV